MHSTQIQCQKQKRPGFILAGFLNFLDGANYQTLQQRINEKLLSKTSLDLFVFLLIPITQQRLNLFQFEATPRCLVLSLRIFGQCKPLLQTSYRLSACKWHPNNCPHTIFTSQHQSACLEARAVRPNILNIIALQHKWVCAG